jgi:hypothetical protein
LKEAAQVGVEVSAVLPAQHFEGGELHHRRLELRLVDHHRRRVGFEHGAGEHDGEGFSDAHRAGARAPPALQRIGFDRLRVRSGTHRRRDEKHYHGGHGHKRRTQFF